MTLITVLGEAGQSWPRICAWFEAPSVPQGGQEMNWISALPCSCPHLSLNCTLQKLLMLKIFFFPILRKQPNPNSKCLLSPKAQLLWQDRAEMLKCCARARDSPAVPSLSPQHKPVWSSSPGCVCCWPTQAVTGTVLCPAPATPVAPAHACCSSGTEGSGRPRHTALTSTDTPTATRGHL